MTKSRWFNRWITAHMENFHIAAGLLCALMYVFGCLLPDGTLQKAGFYGIFGLILLQLTHTQLHACANFLAMHPDSDRIPKEQMKRVNGFYLTGFLIVTGLAMLFLSMLYPARLISWLRETFLSFLRFLVGLFPEVGEGAPAYGGGMEVNRLPPMMEGLSQEPSIAAKLIDCLMALLTVAAAAVFFVYLLCLMYQKICRLFASQTTDGDEMIFLKPEFSSARLKTAGRPEHTLWKDHSINGRIRRIYKKMIQKTAEGRRGVAPSDTPREMETRVGLDRDPSCELLHCLYEKARYSGEGCTRQELDELRRHLKEEKD